MEHYPAVRRNKLLIYVTTCMNLENIMPSEEPDEWLLLGMNGWERVLGIFWNKVNNILIGERVTQVYTLVKRD